MIQARPTCLVLSCVISMSLVSACGEDSAEVCRSNLNWRSPSTNTIACRGAEGCTCASTSVCCVLASPDEAGDGHCTSLASCAGLAFRCDGPEDCGPGTVCCAELNSGGGSSCVAEKDCHGLNTMVLCRSTQDCPGLGRDCVPAAPGSFFDAVAGYCKL